MSECPVSMDVRHRPAQSECALAHAPPEHGVQSVICSLRPSG